MHKPPTVVAVQGGLAGPLRIDCIYMYIYMYPYV